MRKGCKKTKGTRTLLLMLTDACESWRACKSRAWTNKENRQGSKARPQQNQQQEKKNPTYDKSKGVAGCDPDKLCAKLTFPPPICLAAPGGTLELPPMGIPPKPHPAAFPAGPAPHVSHLRQNSQSRARQRCVHPHLTFHSVTCSTRRGPRVVAAAAGLQTRPACGVTVVQPLVSQWCVSTSGSCNQES